MSAFGAEFFRRFYLDPKTRVTSASEMHDRAALIAAVLRQARIPVRRILDAGCGVGLLRRPFGKLLPRARFTGLEHSDYLCRRYGWSQGSVVDYRPRAPFDLVVCYDVLQYLPDRDAARALSNLARLSRSAVYFSALTREDWRANCDRTRTDRSVHLRSGAWYIRRLRRHFRYLGFGVWIRKDVTALLWELECPWL
ncbi:MAG: class I SAM-dependent methyltransferase [Steroidobacterales bacterium]